jgi:hypothetical protein
MAKRRILRIDHLEVTGSHSLTLHFSDGTAKKVNVRPLLRGPMFAPLHDVQFFARVTLDSVSGTAVWPNGADLAPEALHSLPAESQRITEPVRS